MTREDLLQRLKDEEDGFIERKPEGANRSELRRTIVAFANSVPDGRSAILFIGVASDGTPTGVSVSDSLQKTVREVAEQDCYPPVKYQSQVFEVDGKSIVAVIVEPSAERPHFSGPAFVRVGSESKAASSRMYEELIASRNTTAGKILRNKGALVTLATHQEWFTVNRVERTPIQIECRIEGSDAHVVHLYDISSGRHLAYSLDNIRIGYDSAKWRMMLEDLG